MEVSNGADKWRGCRGEAEKGSSAGELSFRQEAWWGTPRYVHEVVPCEDSVRPEWGETHVMGGGVRLGVEEGTLFV